MLHPLPDPQAGADLSRLVLNHAPFVGRKNFGDFLNLRELDGIAVEVGTHQGEFAAQLMARWRGRKLYCVDPYFADYCDGDPSSAGDREQDYRICVRNLQPLITWDRVEIVRNTSLAAAEAFADGLLDFVYIDANHQYAAVCADLRAWWPKLRVGGILAGHDIIGVAWGQFVQPAAINFALEQGVTVELVVEDYRLPLPWSYYMIKTGE